MATTTNGIGTIAELAAKGLSLPGSPFTNNAQCPTRSVIENSMNGIVSGYSHGTTAYAADQCPRYSDISVKQSNVKIGLFVEWKNINEVDFDFDVFLNNLYGISIFEDEGKPYFGGSGDKFEHYYEFSYLPSGISSVHVRNTGGKKMFVYGKVNGSENAAYVTNDPLTPWSSSYFNTSLFNISKRFKTAYESFGVNNYYGSESEEDANLFIQLFIRVADE